MSPPRAVRVPWSDRFPKVLSHSAETAVKQHFAYMAAKAGDAEAAFLLVMDTMGDKAIRWMVDLGSAFQPVLISVHAEERAGVNAIPAVFADILSHIVGWDVEKNVVQANVVNPTGASGFARLAKQAFFKGAVRPAVYIIVDDFVGQGGTIANLRGHLHRQGGRVLCAATLTGKAHSALIWQSAGQLNELRGKHGQLEEWWSKRFGFGFECLTASETRYLINTPTSHRIRDRIEAALAE
ncbi:hypothetical protein F2P45_05415 [Massilia sp. CCM 8733]|uniref:Phosphoribosyltransferase n=1 Tax=Massilia mucilaginosa TaxID=2609282 RepID=A0ABX0NNP1_9BURK|nr:hypothetical protein [Massilia mucilaginosa]